MSNVKQGTVKWFSDSKGFGFLTPSEGGKDLFVHMSEIKMEGFKTLKENQEVDFEDDPDEYEPSNIYDNQKKEDHNIPIAEKIDFIQGLVNQLIGLNLKDWEQVIAEEILWSLDQNGYLAVDPILIADRFNQSENSVKQVLNKVQKLEPSGIASLNLQDCLLMRILMKRFNYVQIILFYMIMQINFNFI